MLDNAQVAKTAGSGPFLRFPSRPEGGWWQVPRIRAATIHLGICLAVAIVLCTVLLFVWYPWPTFQAQGGQDLLILLFSVDVVIGPMVTLVIFKPGKKGLRFDLTVIALMQLSALAYGTHVSFVARPVFITFHNDRFEIISAADVDDEQLKEAKSAEFRSLSIAGPRLAVAEMPADAGERNRIIFSAAFGADITHFQKYYVPYDQAKAETLEKAKPIAELRRLNPAEGAKIDHFLASHHRTEETTRFLPVKARRASLAAMLDASTGDLLGMLTLEPW